MATKTQAMTWTDRELEALENRIKEAYSRASAEVTEKMERYLERFAKQDAMMAQKLQDGLITKQEYAKWRTNHFMMGKNWENMRDTLANDLVNADKIASKMINDSLANVYAENANYTAYEIEKGAGVGLSFSLYDKKTVENLLSENPNFIPQVNPKIPVDERWNRQHIASEMIQGILQGESIPKISKRLANVTTMDKNGAIRNARTYTTSVENQAKMDRYGEAQDMGIDLDKEWMATLDERTRESHRELDGERRANDEAFSNGCMYPADPNGAPEEIYNCRCRIVARIKKHDYTKDARFDKFDADSYEEWKRGKEKEQEETKGLDWIGRIKEIQQMENPTEADIKEAGKIFATQVHEGYLDKFKEEKEEAEKRVAELKDKYKEDEVKYENLLIEESYKESRRIVDGYLDISDSKYFTSVEEAQKYYNEKKESLSEMRKKIDDEYAEYRKLYMDIRTGAYGNNADKLAEMLSQVRDVGSDGLDVKEHLNNSRSQMRQAVEWAYNHYPTDWVKDSVDAGNLSVKKVDRGYYSNFEKIIAISGINEGAQRETAIHELGHRFECVVSGIRDAEKEFYERRTAGEDLKWLGAGYRKDEKTRRDDFLSPYMGKDYKGTAYELVSMGFEYAYTDPLKLAKDEDMETWIYGLLTVR